MQKDPSGNLAPKGGFQNNGWYSGYNYYNGQFSAKRGEFAPGNPAGSGAVSAAVNAQSAAQQRVSPQQFNQYLQQPANSGGVSNSNQPSVSGDSPQMATPQAMLPPKSPLEGMSDQDIYNKYYNTPEAQAAQKEVNDIVEARNKAIGSAQDDPWLSEAASVGRIAQINADTDRKLALANDKLAQIKADAQIRYGISNDVYTKNRQAYQDNLTQFNNLLQGGAFNNASGQDLAQWSVATGIPTNMMQGLIKTANTKGLDVVQFSDNSGQYLLAIDKSGNVVNKTYLGAAKSGGGGDGDVSVTKNIQTQFANTANSLNGKNINGQWWGVFPQLVNQYAPNMSLKEIYNLYANTPIGKKYGSPKEDRKQIQELYNYAKSGKVPE